MATYNMKIGLCRAKVESTYGVDPTLGNDANAIYVEDITAQKEVSEIKRSGMSPIRQGWAPQTGTITPSFKGMFELRPISLNSLSGGNHPRPPEEPILRALGFDVDSQTARQGGSNTSDLVYKLNRSTGSCTLDFIHKANQSGENDYRIELNGLRLDGTLKVSTGERFMLDVNGFAKTFTRDTSAVVDISDADFDDAGVIPDSGTPATNANDNRFRLPLVGFNTTVTMTYDDANGDEVSYSGAFTGLEINLNNAPTVSRTMAEAGGVSEVLNIPDEPPTCVFKMEAADTADFDIDDVIDNKRPVTLTITFEAQDEAVGSGRVDQVILALNLHLASCTHEELEKRLTWSISGAVTYPNQATPSSGMTLTFRSKDA